MLMVAGMVKVYSFPSVSSGGGSRGSSSLIMVVGHKEALIAWRIV